MIRQKSNGLTRVAFFFLSLYYLWYALPFMRITFRSERYKYLFFACFVFGIFILLLARMIHTQLRIQISAHIPLLLPVLVYMALLSVLFLFHIADAAKHIRVSFTFWGTLLVYQLFSFDKKAQIRFGEYLLVLFLLTTITSVIAVISDNSAARAIANASQRPDAIARDYALMRQNVSGIYLFQSLVIFIPVPILMLRNRTKPLLSILLLVFIVFAILHASFTIPLFVLIIACVLAAVSNRKISTILLLTLVAVGILLLPLDTMTASLANAIDNRYISARLYEISVFLRQRSIQGDLQLRLRCYWYSLHTFLAKPFGVGAWYSYRVGEHGIGFHSEILDDMARYGLFSLLFYGVFFTKYYHLLREQWSKIELQGAVYPILLAWILFLLLNIGFRSADESLFMLYILPALPDILLHRLKKEKTV